MPNQINTINTNRLRLLRVRVSTAFRTNIALVSSWLCAISDMRFPVPFIHNCPSTKYSVPSTSRESHIIFVVCSNRTVRRRRLPSISLWKNADAFNSFTNDLLRFIVSNAREHSLRLKSSSSAYDIPETIIDVLRRHRFTPALNTNILSRLYDSIRIIRFHSNINVLQCGNSFVDDWKPSNPHYPTVRNGGLNSIMFSRVRPVSCCIV